VPLHQTDFDKDKFGSAAVDDASPGNPRHVECATIFVSVGGWWLEVGGWKLVTVVGGRRLVADWSVYHLCVVSLSKVYFLRSSLINSSVGGLCNGQPKDFGNGGMG
jgi:hypothetical protein